MKCSLCAKTTNTGALCGPCAEKIARCLLAIAALWPDLQLTLRRQGRANSTSSRRGTATDAALPFRPETAAVADRVREELMWWARVVNADTHIMLPSKHDPRQIARWLVGRLPYWNLGDRARRLFDDLVGMRAAIIGAIDLPADKVSLGPCPVCSLPRFVDEGTLIHRCACGLTVRVAEALVARRKRLEDVLVTWHDLVVLSGVPRRTLERWRQAGRLRPAETIDAEQYWRCLDVIALAQPHHPARPAGAHT